MNVKFYMSDLHACGHIRGEIIARELNFNSPGTRVDCKTAIMLSDFPGTDVMVFQRQLSPAVLHKMRTARQNNIATIYDIDDDLFSVPANMKEVHDYYARPETQDCLTQFVNACDVLTVSTLELAKALRPRTTRPILIVENGLDTARWVREPRVKDRLMIGWMASGTHKMDAPLVEDALYQIMCEFPYVDLCFIGWVGFDDIPKLKQFASRIKMLPWQDINVLPDIMSDFDIGLAPLIEHPFNACKSGIKALQYWAGSTPVVCSPSAPYECVTNGTDGLYASGSPAWYEALKALIVNPELRQTLGENGKRKLMDKYAISRTAENWKAVFEYACANRPNMRH